MSSILVALAPWILGAVGIGIFVTVGWSQIKKHGAEKWRRKRAEAEAEFDKKRLKTMHAADLTDDQHDDFIDRL